MLVALALAAQLTAVQTPDELLARQRMLLTQGFDEVAEELDKMEQRSRGTREAQTPVLGLIMELKELGGTPPWRAIMVADVLPGSAADIAGIKPGDRLSAIGSRWLDRHTCVAAALYMADFPRSVPLVIERDGRLRAVTLRRKMEPCITAAYHSPALVPWHTRIGSLRKTVSTYHSQVPSLVTIEGIGAAEQNLYATSRLTIMTNTLLEQELRIALTASCGVPFRD